MEKNKNNAVYEVLVGTDEKRIRHHITRILDLVRENGIKDIDMDVSKLENLHTDADVDAETRLISWRTFFLVALRRDARVSDYVCMHSVKDRGCGAMSYAKTREFLSKLPTLTETYLNGEVDEETFVERAVVLFHTDMLVDVQSWLSAGTPR